MNVSLGERWEGFVQSALKSGRYCSANEGLRMVEDREARLLALRETLYISIQRGCAHSDEAVGAQIDAALDAWEQTPEAP